jgi:hypothetical protein
VSFSAAGLIFHLYDFLMARLHRSYEPAVRMEFMQDLLMVVLTVVFFTVALLYVRGCERLR